MKREELDRKFEKTLGEALNESRLTANGRLPYAIAALAIAVRGLWPNKKKANKSRGNVLPGEHS